MVSTAILICMIMDARRECCRRKAGFWSAQVPKHITTALTHRLRMQSRRRCRAGQPRFALLPALLSMWMVQPLSSLLQVGLQLRSLVVPGTGRPLRVVFAFHSPIALEGEANERY